MTFKEDLEYLLKGISEFDIQGDAAFSEKLASFWNNVFRWLDQGRNVVIGFCPKVNILPNLRLECEKTTFRQDLSVYVCTAYSEEDPEKIQAFVAEGGGLLIGGHAWWWAQEHPQQNPLQDFSGNKILNKMDLSVLKETISNRVFKAPQPSQANYFHFRRLLHRFAGHVLEGRELRKQDEELLKQLEMECAHFLSMKAYDSYSYTQILSILTDILKVGLPQVSDENPVSSAQDLMRLNLESNVYNVYLSQDALLPFLIKNIPTLPVVNNRKIKINAQTAENEEWISTERVQVWNMWGGLIYLVAPPDVKVEEEEVVVEVAVPAPYYKTG
ncbi:TRPM8 channel-associated factor homolog [Kryptolebias marmoratus]|uniref:TRPM8 channel-associated factor homolog n=1 Tax=Kryptolebias marmoratus TaxID=37003 RepID=UPI0018ACB4DC|nr:TRPM8 channel-associated factor homolog [Kryptolebias marmoratus]